MPTSKLSTFLTCLFLSILPDPQFCGTGRVFGAAQSQAIEQLPTGGQITSKPIVNNGRILYHIAAGFRTVSIVLANVRNESGPTFTRVANDIEIVFTGSPDLDEHGNVVYVAKVGDRHQVFLHDARTGASLQLTDNSDISGSPQIGLGTVDAGTGFPRVANGRVVFRDTEGNVFLYDPTLERIRQINLASDQTANMGSAIDTEKRFEFDGQHIVWLHEKVLEVIATPGGQQKRSEITVYLAAPPYNDEPIVIDRFNASTRTTPAFIIGQVVETFFVACGKQIAWQYLPDPAGLTFDNWIIKYYDGSSTQTIRSHGPVGQRSLRIHNGQVVWRELAPEPINEDKVFFFDGENIHEVAALPNPAPAEAPADSRFWTEIHEVDVNLGTVVWSATEVECVLRIGTLCLYLPTGNIGVFTNASGETTVEVLKTSFIGGSLGGFDFDNGLLAFFASFTPAAPDIYTYPLFSTETATNAALILTDTTPKPSILVTRGEPNVVVDGFKVSVLPRNCGALLGEGVDITSLTFEGTARSGIDANLLDITSVRLYWDINADGDLADDPLVGEGSFDDSTLTFTLAPPMTVLPGDEEHFLLSFELDESICPCNTYEALLSAGNIEAFTTQTHVRPTRVGSSRGRIVLPEPRFATFSSEEMFGGDEQAGFAGTTLPDRLGVRVENFPIDCGQASFKIVPIAGVGLNNALLRDSQSQSPRLVLPFRQENGDAVADVEMTLGDKDGLYAVEATIEFIEPADCKSPRHIFREHAGRIVLEVVDVKNPQFYDATPVSGGPSPWDVKITSDFERLATGGDTRVATTTDGVSMLLIRAKLIGFPEAPPGDVEFSLSGGGDVGSLIASFGGSVPPAAGATSVASPWREEHGLIKSFALYTPPLHFGEDPAAERALTLTAKYSLPSDPGNVQERTTDIALFRPPILFVHGMWSNMNTWGTAYTQSAPRYEKHFADYSGGDPSGSAVSFSDNGTVIRAAVYGIVQDRGSRGIATTQAVVVAHSMGGLLTRQFIADENGLSYRRPDNFGQGDIDKFITMGTPHWGSPISWLTKSLRESTNPLIQQPFLELINGIGLNIFSGAIDSMCPGSPQLQALGESVVPAHAIQGWYLDTSDPDVSDDAFLLLFLEATKDIRSGKPVTPLTVLLKVLDIAGTISTSLLYSFDKTDLLVTNLSQGSDLLPQQRSEFDRTTHMALGLNLSPVIESETESQEIAERVFALVDAPVDDPTLFAPKLPAPRVQDSQIQCTASGPAPGLFRLSAAPEPFEAVDRAVSIQYPLDGETVHSGDTLFVTAQAIADGDFLSILFLSPAQGLLSDEAPFQVEMKIPDEVVGRFPIVVAATDAAGQVHVSRPVTLNVVPMATLESMVVTPAPLFMVPGSRVRLRIDGIYSDAVSRNLTSAKTGTFYQSDDEQIVTIGANGTVQAHTEGRATILISNGRIDQTLEVRVGR